MAQPIKGDEVDVSGSVVNVQMLYDPDGDSDLHTPDSLSSKNVSEVVDMDSTLTNGSANASVSVEPAGEDADPVEDSDPYNLECPTSEANEQTLFDPHGDSDLYTPDSLSSKNFSEVVDMDSTLTTASSFFVTEGMEKTGEDREDGSDNSINSSILNSTKSNSYSVDLNDSMDSSWSFFVDSGRAGQSNAASVYDHCDWSNEEEFPLYHTDENFRIFVDPYIKLFQQYGPESNQIAMRTHKRLIHTHEFWNYVASKLLPREYFWGDWIIVNPERKGWPLHYEARGTHLKIEPVFKSPLREPVMKAAGSFDEPFLDLESIEVPLYQLRASQNQDDAVPSEDPNSDMQLDERNEAVAKATAFLELYRKFYDYIFIYPPCKSLWVFTQLPHYMYDIMVMFYALESRSEGGEPLMGRSMRAQAMSLLKQYHSLRNKMQYVLMIKMRETGEANNNEYSLLSMQMDKLKVDLIFLYNKSIRPLLACPSDVGVLRYSSYEYILVVSDASSDDLKEIHDQLADKYNLAADKKMKICDDLEAALKGCVAGTTIFVASGNYNISSLHQLAEGGRLIGIPVDNKLVAISPSDDVGDVWLMFTGPAEAKLEIENVCFVVNTITIEDCPPCLLYTISCGTLSIMNAEVLDKNTKGDVSKLMKKSESSVVVADNCNFEFELS